MKKHRKLLLAILALAAAAVLALVFLRPKEDGPAAQLSPSTPQVLTLWHYYNGAHQQAFDALVLSFNETVGREKGIIIEARSQGGIGALTRELLASARGDFGADPMPDIFAAYADMAWDIAKLRPLADLSPWFSEAELNEYIPSYIAEGRLTGDKALSVFPVAKSTEVLMLNSTEWYLFSAETGADAELLSSWEGMAQLARMYYEWTDALTPDVPDDGRAFFGLDALANYLVISSQQLGVEMFSISGGKPTVTLDETVMRRIWDTFVIPTVNGWYASYGAYRTDDVKTGRLVAVLGSTSGAVYFPKEVTREDGTSYPINGKCLPMPVYTGGQPCAVQQGAGMVVTAGDPVREYAATVFLKWFTQETQNLRFSLASSYLPVKKAANDPTRLDKAISDVGISGMLRDSLLTSARMIGEYTLYTSPAFDNCYAVREALEDGLSSFLTSALAERDRLIASGMSREDAVAQLTDEAAFRTLLTTLRNDIAQILN